MSERAREREKRERGEREEREKRERRERALAKRRQETVKREG